MVRKMRSFYFRPQPVLTLITLIALVILIKLGLWQKARLEWKTELLASVEAAVNAPAMLSVDEIQTALSKDEFTEFRRVDIQAELAEMDAPYLVFTARNRDISWRRFQIAESMGHYIFADIGIVADSERGSIKVTPAPIRLIGYMRLAEWQETPKSDSSPEQNRWFGFNPMATTHDWARLSGLAADSRFYIETVPGVLSGDSLPPKRPEIANNHFDYMLTWFSLAIVLSVFYVLIHIRDGNAGLRAKDKNR